MNHWRDWSNQAERDLAHAKNALDDADFEWSAFASQQSAEKAVNALIFVLGGEPWGHSIAVLLENLPEKNPATVMEAGIRLDKHYLPSRYPNGLPAGHPGEVLHSRRGRKSDHRCDSDPRILPEPLTSIVRHAFATFV